LQVAELADDFLLPLNLAWIYSFKLLNLILFFELILDKTTPSVQHFTQSVVQPLGHLQFSLPRQRGCLGIGLVGIVPDVMRDEPLHVADGAFRKELFFGFAQFANESLYVLNENVISSNHDLLLLWLLHFF